MKKLMATGMAGLMLAAGLPGNTAQAGQREWATAGKILTGVVIGGAIVNSCRPEATERRVVYRYERPVESRVTYLFHESARCEPPPRSYPPPRCQPPPAQREPIISHLGDGRRLYQPRIHGAKAYLQVWSEVRGEWVSIKEYPSIW